MLGNYLPTKITNFMWFNLKYKSKLTEYVGNLYNSTPSL